MTMKVKIEGAQDKWGVGDVVKSYKNNIPKMVVQNDDGTYSIMPLVSYDTHVAGERGSSAHTLEILQEMYYELHKVDATLVIKEHK